MRSITLCRITLASLAWLAVATFTSAQDAPLKDKRLAPPISYNEKYYPWAPPATKEAWEARRPCETSNCSRSTGRRAS